MSRHHDRIKNDPRWKAARQACLERDDHQCTECGATEQLEVDHIVDLALNPDLAFDNDNLRVLCRPCHSDKPHGIAEMIRLEYVNEKYRDTLAAIL